MQNARPRALTLPDQPSSSTVGKTAPGRGSLLWRASRCVASSTAGNKKSPQGKKHSRETGRTSGKPEVPQGNEHHINKCSNGNSCKEADSAKRETVSGSKTCHGGTAAMGKTGATGEQVPQGQQRAGMGGRAAGREARGSC